MRRARQRSLAAFSAVSAFWALSLGGPAPARAFHAGNVFDKPPGAGGGGGLFYTGALRDKGWDCTACHIDPPGKIQLRVQVDPPDLFQTFHYAPGQTYSFTVTMEGESVGMASPLSNYNTLAISIVGATGAPVGSMSGFAAEEFYTGWPTTILSGGQRVGATSWTFQWIPGEAGAGMVTIFVAGVDGNGANSSPGQTLTDPFGDDVYIGTISLEEGAATASAAGAPGPGAALHADSRHAGILPTRREPATIRDVREAPNERGPASVGALACAAGLCAFGASRRRRLRTRSAGEPS